MRRRGESGSWGESRGGESSVGETPQANRSVAHMVWSRHAPTLGAAQGARALFGTSPPAFCPCIVAGLFGDVLNWRLRQPSSLTQIRSWKRHGRRRGRLPGRLRAATSRIAGQVPHRRRAIANGTRGSARGTMIAEHGGHA